MSLSCGCDWENAPSVYKECEVEARKAHTCCECKRIIQAGETYQYVFGVWDGVASSFHTCEKCADLRESLTALGFCCSYGDLHGEHQEYLTHYRPQKLVTR